MERGFFMSPSQPPASHNTHSARGGASPDAQALTFIYPSLGRLLEGGAALTKMRNSLDRSHQEYERVIRRGTAEDAARATRIAEAYRITLSFLGELDASARQTGP
jgi:hypothetical protein